MTEIPLAGTFTVEKTADEQRILFGWANIAAKSDGTTVVDSHDEYILPDDLETAAYRFVLTARASGEDHNGQPADGQLVESVMFTDQKLAALAVDPFTGETNSELADALAKHMHRGWWVGFHVPDEDAWGRAKTVKGQFSIEGVGRYAAE